MTTPAQFVVFLRAIAHVPMQPFRNALEMIGGSEVKSFGMSGNLIFRSALTARALELQISELFSTPSFVRSRTELARVVSGDPFRGMSGASVLFLTHSLSAERRRVIDEVDFEEPRPLIRGRTIYFVHPARRRGRKSPVDFEKLTERVGTARSSRIVVQILDQMRKGGPGRM